MRNPETLKGRSSIARPVMMAFAFALLLAGAGASVPAQSVDDEQDATPAQAIGTAGLARKLTSPDPLERQRAAEELARLAAVDQLKLVAGYRLQEKNARVRLALDWALYRMGKTETLFNIVRDLDSSRRNQSDGYLSQLESPDPLYIFLERVNGKTLARLLTVLSRLGDTDTLDLIKPYLSSYDQQVANAAQFATREINRRLQQPPANTATRPRQTGNSTDPEP